MIQKLHLSLLGATALGIVFSPPAWAQKADNDVGSESTNFSIPGFTHEQRTTATVVDYFADVAAPRGSGASVRGYDAGPGALCDLQNIQVLKGPQGTQFDRNSTGGAVLLDT